MPSSLRLVLALAACLVTSVACSSPGSREPDATWAEGEFETDSSRVLWEFSVLALDKVGFPLGSKVDPGRMVAITGWRTSLSPFRGRGFRQMAVLEINRLPEGGHGVRVRVKHQVNESLVRPTDLTYAEWKWQPDDETTARIVLQHIRAYVATELDLTEKEVDPFEVPEFDPEK